MTIKRTTNLRLRSTKSTFLLSLAKGACLLSLAKGACLLRLTKGACLLSLAKSACLLRLAKSACLLRLTKGACLLLCLSKSACLLLCLSKRACLLGLPESWLAECWLSLSLGLAKWWRFRSKRRWGLPEGRLLGLLRLSKCALTKSWNIIFVFWASNNNNDISYNEDGNPCKSKNTPHWPLPGVCCCCCGCPNAEAARACGCPKEDWPREKEDGCWKGLGFPNVAAPTLVTLYFKSLIKRCAYRRSSVRTFCLAYIFIKLLSPFLVTKKIVHTLNSIHSRTQEWKKG